MYRLHGAPELQREESAVDVLCARVVRLKRRLRILIVVGSLAASLLAVDLASDIGFGWVELQGRVLGIVFGTVLLGALVGSHAIAAGVTGLFAARWARELAAAERCDAEPLLDAARILAGGSL